MRAWMIVILLAGCATAPGDNTTETTEPVAPGEPTGPLTSQERMQTTSTSSAPDLPLSFHDWKRMTYACDFSCFETTVAIDGAGRIILTAANNDELYVSQDGGRTFDPVPIPPAATLDPRAFSADNQVQTAGDGRLAFSALYFDPAGIAIHGIQVAMSADGGFTWDSNVFLRVDGGDVETLQTDRQWLGFDGPRVLLQHSHPLGLMVATSDDGAAFSDPVLAAPTPLRGTIGQAGPIIVVDGTMLIPHVCNVCETGIALRASMDGSAWTDIPVALGTDASGALANWFPIATPSGPGVAVAWINSDGNVWVSRSDDLHEWEEPVLIGSSDVGPWISDRGAMDVYWYKDRQPTLTRLERDGGREEVTMNVTIDHGSANTHFAHFAHAPDGRAVVTWSQPGSTPAFALERLRGDAAT